ncbi:hypothetical protein KSP39_PZI024043 [Platanthera zijinensis]|uniref:Uncharacterized protein n=1 Tax=Platanthera zijinensis TaxID=2320716 RepID=A0AAP0ATJ4_9ASPA
MGWLIRIRPFVYKTHGSFSTLLPLLICTLRRSSSVVPLVREAAKAFYLQIQKSSVLSMNHAMQRNAFAASCDHLAAGDRKSPVICPKPRRLGPVGALPSTDVARPLRRHTSHQADPCGSKPGIEFLDYFIPKGGESLSMSPPFFCGSPPTRAANPVVNDVRFGENRPVEPLPSQAPVSVAGGASPMSVRNSGNCARTKNGLKPAPVRIEGFDCLGSDRRRGCGITAVA